MYYYDLWEYDTEDFLINCIETGFDGNVACEFFKLFSIEGFDMIVERKRTRSILLVDGNENYSFSSTDLLWISDRTDVTLFRNQNMNILFVNLPCFRDTYYLEASALIKVFNEAFRGKCCYIFRVYDGIAVGSMRSFNEKVDNNFCVTQIFNKANIEEAMEFWYEFLFAEYDALPSVIINYSPQEDYQYCPQIDDPSRLDDCNGQAEEQLIYSTYREVCDILKNVGDSADISSFDVLEDAIIAEKKVQENSRILENNSENNENTYGEYSAEAYANAEVLLKEMIKKS